MIAGRYSLDREIGRGGMGAVWLGSDELLGRQVALKRIGLQPGAAGIDLVRAEREARLAARLNHPHVVAIFNFVIDPDTQDRWLVMEYVEGTTLAQLVRDQGGLAPEVAAPLLWQAADALASAHAAGIVHRDVKPSNILVGPDGQVKLTDFGIARTATDPALTQTGLVIGSPTYLAPEVASGRRGNEAADVWSLGATTFHVLSGSPPYDFDDNMLGGLYRIVNEEPPGLPDAGRLAPLLDGTMVKDPARRWSMEQVRDFLAADGGWRTADVPDVVPRVVPEVGPDETPTKVWGTGGGAPVGGRTDRRVLVGVVAAAALVVVLVVVLFATLPDDPGADVATPRAGDTSTADAQSPRASPTPQPTVQGMESFIRVYVATVGSDPAAAWRMLTPRFQRQSGGFDTYREFWSGVGPGTILEMSADPGTLVVSYRVRFENFGTGERPTVLVLKFDNGRYRIAGERTEGFEPAG